MDISAADLRRKSINSSQIRRTVEDLLKTIRSNILDSDKNGMTYVYVDIPTNFNISGLSNKDAQTIIYSDLIKKIEKQGFVVGLTITDSVVTYCIDWGTQTDTKELKNMRDDIASRLINK
jgi:aspartyl/asparaginyl-tRNA synthetase